jgi:hypothetical protein
VAIGCAASVPTRVASSTSPESRVSRAPDVELFWKGDEPWARRGDEEWRLGDMRRQEMVFSPDGRRFAYLRQGTSSYARVLVRNLLGDPVNDFAVYRPGVPEALAWLDNRRLGYLAPIERGRPAANVFVVHDAETGEVLSARPGFGFTWDARHRHIAFLAGLAGKQALVVDGNNVWPRSGFTKLHGDPVWSNDGHGIAIVDEGYGAPKLVVLVEFKDPQGDLTWPVPREALSPGLKVFWASDSKVVIGESALKPKFVAGWDRLQ